MEAEKEQGRTVQGRAEKKREEQRNREKSEGKGSK
jgi:hypothetical protein